MFVALMIAQCLQKEKAQEIAELKRQAPNKLARRRGRRKKEQPMPEYDMVG